MEDTGARNKKALAIVLASLLILLGLATWGGIKLGTSSAANQVQDQKAKLESAAEQLSQSRAASTTLQTQLDSIQASLSQYQPYVSALRQDNTVLQTQLASAQAQLSQMQSQYSSLQQDNAALRAQLASAQQVIAALQAQLQAWDTWSHNAPRSSSTTTAGPSITLSSILKAEANRVIANEGRVQASQSVISRR